MLSFVGLWDADLLLATELLLEDGRNNSAWNQRWFVPNPNPNPNPNAVIQRRY